MTTIGYATLQLIPSLAGVSDSVNKQLGGALDGKKYGKAFGRDMAAGMRASESDVKRAADNYAKLYDHVADATGKLRTAEAQLQQLRKTGANDARIVTAEERVAKARRDEIRLVNEAKVAYSQLDQLRNNAGNGPSILSRLVSEQKARDIGTKVGRVLGLAIAGAAGAGIAGIGYTLTKGFQRLESIDQATFKLKALGHSGAETKTIMDNATASVKGTAFSLAEAATTAASAVAAGIQPGKDLTQYLTNVADASAVAGTSMKDMGDIFNGIQTQNKAYTGDLDQLATRGIPIFQWLAKEYGVTGDALSKMVQNGEVDAAHFNKAISDNIGGAAKNMGQSFQGAVDNAETAIARLGAHFLGSIFGDKDGSQLAGPTEAIGKLTEKFDKIDAWVTAHGPQIHQFFATMVEDAKVVGEELGKVLGFLTEHPRLIEAVVIAFAGWKAITAISDVVTGLRGVSTALGLLPTQAETAGAGIGGGLGKGLGGLGFILRGGVWVLPVAIAATIIWGDRDSNPKTQTSGDPAKGQPQLPGTGIGVPGSTTPDFATGSALPPDTPVPPGFEIRDGKLVKIVHGGGRAFGGPISGAGGPKSDSIPIWASNGEHMLSASDVQAMGGQGGVYAFRAALHRAGGGALDFWKLGGTGGDSDVKGHGVGDIGKRIDSPLKPRNPIWGDERRGIIQGPGWNPRGNQDDVGVIAPWWMFPGDKPSKQRGGIFGMDPRSPDWERRRDIFGQVPGRYNPPVKTPFQTPGPTPGAQWWGPSPERLLGFASGGAIGPDVSAAEKLVGHPYSQGSRFDCSGDVARVINAALGMGGGLMSTKTAREWLAARGFVPGTGGPGQITVGWYDHGPNPNDGHMAMTLSDGRPAEGGGSHGVFLVGAGASGASSPQFDQHMFLPTIYGEGPAGPSSTSPFAGGSAIAAATGGGGGAAPATSGPSTGGGAGSGFSLPSSISGLAGFGLDELGKGVGTTGSGSDLSLFGKAAGSAVSGQVDSLLGVFGVPGTPGWLKAASMLVSGIKVGGGSSAAPLSATPTISGTPPPDDPGNMHGGRAGQAPGPQTVYNIRTATVEDAFLAAQRKQNERNAAKLSRF